MVASLIPLAFLALFPFVRAECVSYGIDFQNGGSYFINSLSTDAFTLVSQFEGCTGTANVLLADSDDNLWQCSDVAADQDDVSVISTCPITKDQMYSGVWTIIILDNNGVNPSTTGQRTIDLTVGQQQTITYTPTVTALVTTTPTVTSTSSSTEIDTTTLSASTTTKTLSKGRQTIWEIPHRVTVFSTITQSLSRTTTQFLQSVSTVSKTASCSVPVAQHSPDPPAPSSLILLASSVMADPSAASGVAAIKRKRDGPLRSISRRLFRRDPDAVTLTITDTNTDDFVTTTSTSTADPTTVIAYVTVSTTLTITPPVITITATPVTLTAPTPTRTKLSRTRVTVMITKTAKLIAKITTVVTPPALASSCSASGGTLS